MLCNLQWLKALNIDYSISSFDTDPFEPQPNAVGTIFPFIVNHASGKNNHFFVELPYTLPHDSTIFIILQERSIDIWKSKLDWIAKYGGMVLLNTHPDYMNFENSHFGKMNYPVSLYQEFLEYIKNHYNEKFHHGLPTDIAAVTKHQILKKKALSDALLTRGKYIDSNKKNGDPLVLSAAGCIHSGKTLRVAMLTYSFYENDGRVRRYAETLAQRGACVDVISLCNEKQSSFDRLKGVNVYRVQKRVRDEKGKSDYFFRIFKFFFRSAALLSSNHLKQPYDIIHVHSVPDFEVFATFIPKIAGAKIILDIHDPVPDFFEAKFGYDKNTIYFKILSLIEKYSCHYADHVITVTDYWRDVIKCRSNITTKKISAIVNYPDTAIFNITKAKKRYNSEDCFKILYPGTLNKHCALHIVVEAIGLLRNEIPELKFDIYGKGTEENYLRSLVKKLGLEQTVHFHGVVPIEKVPGLMANADIGVALLGGNHNYFRQALNVKLFEFLAMGLPAIASRVDSIRKYLGENIALLSNPNDPKDVARCIKELYKNQDKREQLRKAGLTFAQKNNWGSQANMYLNIIQNLLPHNKNKNFHIN